MNNVVRCLAGALLAGLAGCAVFDWARTDWVVDETPIEATGPGRIDALFFRCQRNKYEYKDEGKTAILVKRGVLEEIVRPKSANIRSTCFSEAYGRLEDGTKAYYLYPGFQRIEEDVKATGEVAVLFDGGPDRCRRFFKSENVEGALGYRDEKLGSAPLVPEPMRSRLLACWDAPEVTVDEQASIFLLLDNELFSDRKYQQRLAFVLSKTAHWRRVFDKVKSDGLTDADVIKALALGVDYKGIGGGDGDEPVAIWAVGKLSDLQRVDVVRNAALMSVRSNALERIASAGNASQGALDAALARLVLDREVPRVLREPAVGKLSESASRDVYCKADEFWLGWCALAKIGASARSGKDVSSRSHRWLQDGTVELSDRAKIYLTLGSEPLTLGEQKVVAEMLEIADWRRDVLLKCSNDKSLTDAGIRLALAKQSYEVDETVAIWAVEGLADKDLLDVAGSSASSRVGFKAVRLLKDRASVESVAIGKYNTVLRLEAINRLTAQSEEALRSIATSADANFRSVALERMNALGLSMKTIREEVDAVAAREQAARKAAEAKLQKERESAIGHAKREIELAKIDETIVNYRRALSAGTLGGKTLAFTGTVLSVASRSWKPRIRIAIKGARETLYALCRGSGRADAELAVGCRVSVEGAFRSGTAAEVTLENVRFETKTEGAK